MLQIEIPISQEIALKYGTDKKIKKPSAVYPHLYNF
jgi:hypothetical protein